MGDLLLGYRKPAVRGACLLLFVRCAPGGDAQTAIPDRASAGRTTGRIVHLYTVSVSVHALHQNVRGLRLSKNHHDVCQKMTVG